VRSGSRLCVCRGTSWTRTAGERLQREEAARRARDWSYLERTVIVINIHHCRQVSHVVTSTLPNVTRRLSQLHFFGEPAIPPQVDFLSARPGQRDHLDAFLFQPGALSLDPETAIASRGDDPFRGDDALMSMRFGCMNDRRTCHGISVPAGSIFNALPTCLASARNPPCTLHPSVYSHLE